MPEFDYLFAPAFRQFRVNVTHLLAPARGAPPSKPPSKVFEDGYPYAPLDRLGIDDTPHSLIGERWEGLTWFMREYFQVLSDENVVAKLEFYIDNPKTRRRISSSSPLDTYRDKVVQFRQLRVNEFGGHLPDFNVMSIFIEHVILHELAECDNILRDIVTENKHHAQPAATRILALETQLEDLKNSFHSIEEKNAVEKLLESADVHYVLLKLTHDLHHNLDLLMNEERDWTNPRSHLSTPVGIGASNLGSQSSGSQPMEDMDPDDIRPMEGRSHPEEPVYSDEGEGDA
ncbi:hypothetical protein CALVIDRAFT_567746 [Calocera viscosa TUFC12733]|uniref:Uncharacterized protein n=1 Tax=Calocera viscosa (strain TUFC12733) TaxID=1330018 RepID=A0A167HUV8_CALVF|nr:hypothetical protein CALVIDRAFT_567746 [Calocera viscosa TUFC12733]